MGYLATSFLRSLKSFIRYGSFSKDYFNVTIVFTIGFAIAYACSIGALSYNGLPVIVCLYVSQLSVHWMAFIPSYALGRRNTMIYVVHLRMYLYYSLRFILLHQPQKAHLYSFNTCDCFGIDLGSKTWFFLIYPCVKSRRRRRFREVKQKFSGFLVWWTLSALWVFLTTVNALVMIINNVSYHNDYYFYFGLVLWVAGFSFEVVADEQKRKFRLQSSNKDQFISTGLWSISRHPNYFGEILLWIGMAVIAFQTLQGWQHISLISPIFIYLLLTRMSGVNLLEKYADEKWGGDENYQVYKRDTPVLIPFLKQ